MKDDQIFMEIETKNTNTQNIPDTNSLTKTTSDGEKSDSPIVENLNPIQTQENIITFNSEIPQLT